MTNPLRVFRVCAHSCLCDVIFIKLSFLRLFFVAVSRFFSFLFYIGSLLSFFCHKSPLLLMKFWVAKGKNKLTRKQKHLAPGISTGWRQAKRIPHRQKTSQSTRKTDSAGTLGSANYFVLNSVRVRPGKQIGKKAGMERAAFCTESFVNGNLVEVPVLSTERLIEYCLLKLGCLFDGSWDADSLRGPVI